MIPLILAVSVQAETLPKVSPAYVNAVRSYAHCIEAKMVELEPSKAGIDDIFEAAETQCAGAWGDSVLILQDEFEKTAPAPSGKTPGQLSIEILDGVASSAKDRARVTILRKRAGLPPIDVKKL
jgi:hypothetical protein